MKLNAFLIKDTTGLPFQLFGVLYSNNCNALTAEKNGDQNNPWKVYD